MLTQKDLDEIESRLEDTFVTKDELQQVKSDLMDKLDSILKEILASREEQTLLVHQVSGHEDRLHAIENNLQAQAS